MYCMIQNALYDILDYIDLRDFVKENRKTNCAKFYTLKEIGILYAQSTG